MVILIGLWVAYEVMVGASDQVAVFEAFGESLGISRVSLVLMGLVFFGLPVGFWLVMMLVMMRKR